MRRLNLSKEQEKNLGKKNSHGYLKVLMLTHILLDFSVAFDRWFVNHSLSPDIFLSVDFCDTILSLYAWPILPESLLLELHSWVKSTNHKFPCCKVLFYCYTISLGNVSASHGGVNGHLYADDYQVYLSLTSLLTSNITYLEACWTSQTRYSMHSFKLNRNNNDDDRAMIWQLLCARPCAKRFYKYCLFWSLQQPWEVGVLILILQLTKQADRG